VYNNLNGQSKLFVNEVRIVQIGEIKRDIDVGRGKAKNFFGDYTEGALIKEGRRLYRKHPEYEYLRDDPWVEFYKKKDNTDGEFYHSIVYAYMVDRLLKEHQELACEYEKIKKETIDESQNSSITKGKAEVVYSSFNNRFLCWYQDYLREQADPGCLERERQEHERKQKALETARQVEKWKAKQQEQQDLASGKRVVCPYCHSTNTEKISTMSRAVSVSLVGAASGKIGKQWHCNNCKSDF